MFYLDDGAATLSGLTVTGGIARGYSGSFHVGDGNGGGVFNPRGTLTMTDCTISGNSATDYFANESNGGGGLCNGFLATTTLTNCTISGNSTSQDSDAGGGVCNFGGLTLTNCTISGNSATKSDRNAFGGGVSNFGTATLTNCTVSGNTSNNSLGDTGGIASNFAHLTLTNTIVAGNTGALYGRLEAASTNNLIGGNPLLAPLGNYGGPTQTMPLFPGSPAIDAGTTRTGIPTTDQRGLGRVGPTDIGAVESQGYSLSLVSGTPQTAGVSLAFANPLVVRVAPNYANDPVNSGVAIFAAPPASGASALLSATSATIAGGVASITARANSLGGTYTVTATEIGSAAGASFSLTNIPLASIAVFPSNPTVAKGVTQQFTATGTYQDNSTASITISVTWASATPSVATINSTGLASTLLTTGTGSSVITASLGGVTSPGATLTVTAATLVSIAVLPSNRSVVNGFTQQFTATGTYTDGSTKNLTNTVTWASATPSVATIDSTGLAQGLAAGTSAITAELGGVMSPADNLTVIALVSLAVTPSASARRHGADAAVHGHGHLQRRLDAEPDQIRDLGVGDAVGGADQQHGSGFGPGRGH